MSSKSRCINGRTVVSIAYCSSRKVSSQPYQSPQGLLKVSLALVPCLCVGGTVAKHLAELLEEWNIFCYEEDDDDD